MGWNFETTDRAGVTTGFVVPRQVAIERRLNGATVVTLEADSADAVGLVHGRLVKGWRAPDGGGPRVLRVHGRVLGVTPSGGTDRMERVEVLLADGFTMLGQRTTFTPWEYTGVTARTIIADQLAIEEGRFVGTGLYVNPSGDSGPPRDRSYESSKNVAEIVTQLAEVDNGFYFRVDPYDDTNVNGDTLFSELVILYPASGEDTTASFEYGDGTAGNLEAAQATVAHPVNYVRAYGGGEAGAQLTSTVWDEPSIRAYGVHATDLTLTDVTEQATLDQHALDALFPDPRVTYSCSPAALASSLPVPWEDFDVGDHVTLRLAGTHPYLQGHLRCRVTAYRVTIDADGVERLADLTLENL